MMDGFACLIRALSAAGLSLAAFAAGADDGARAPGPSPSRPPANGPAAASPTASGLTIQRVDTRADRLALFLADDHGRPYGGFDALADDLRAHGLRLVLAMNAGMYAPDRQPVGLFVADGRERHPLDPRADRPGNFYLQPNGVFALAAGGPRIVDTAAWARTAPAGVTLATQSGPMLLQDGRLAAAVRPPARPASASATPSRFTRNAVCVDGPVVTFAIADRPLTLRQFAVALRDEAGCRDALYLDGAISSVYAPALGRDDDHSPLGPILAVVGDAPR